MKNLMVSSCGTSILINGAKNADINPKQMGSIPLAQKIYEHANAGEAYEVNEEIRVCLQHLIGQLDKNLNNLTPESASTASAELHALIKYYNGDLKKAGKDHHILICTDTWLGKESAKLIKRWLQARNFSVALHEQKDLRTDNMEEFQLALKDLGAELSETLKSYEQKGYHIVFNLNGGFKSIQGFLQTLGMFRAHEIIYLFESGKELMRIPKIPIKIDTKKEVKNNLLTFRRLNAGLDATNTRGISEALLLVLDGQTALSTWGDMAWQEHHASIYGERLHPSPSIKVRFSRRFEQEAEKISTAKKIELNRRLDQLARYLELENQPNPSSLTFKKLKGKPVEGASHEFYAWSDSGAWRVFGHFKENFFILDKLDRHL